MIQPKATTTKGKTPKRDTTAKNHQPTDAPMTPEIPYRAPAPKEVDHLTAKVTHLKKQLKDYKTALRALVDAFDDALDCQLDDLQMQFESLKEKRVERYEANGDDNKGGPDPPGP